MADIPFTRQPYAPQGYTLAQLPSASLYPPYGPNCFVAYTSDKGPCYSDGANWNQYSGAVTAGNSILLKTSANFATDFQTANDALRDAGGGTIVLQAGGVYTLAANIKLFLDIGTGVSLEGNNAWIYASNHTNTTALSLESRPYGGSTPISGYDGSTFNYFQKSALCRNFRLIGPGDGIGFGTSNGIDVNMTAEATNRAPRPTVQNVVVYGFNKNICLRNQGYLCAFTDCMSTDGGNGLYLNGGINSAENQVFRNCVFGNNTVGLCIDTAAETSTAQSTDVFFDSCSFDYNATQIKLISGNGTLRFEGGNYEHNNNSQTYAMDFTSGGTANNTLLVTFSEPKLNFTGTAASGFTNYFGVGQNVQIKLTDPLLNGILGSGQTIGGLAYPALANVTNTTNSDFEVVGSRTFSIPTLAPLISLDLRRCLLSDPGFEQTTLVDEIFVYKDTATTQYQTARATGTNIASITTSTGKPNGGARSLDITLGAQGAVTAGTRVFGILLPRRSDRIFGQWAWAASGGTGTFIWAVTPVIVDSASNAVNPIILFSGTAIKSGGPNTPTTTYTKQGWGGSSYTNDPRLLVPSWASHVLITFDLSLINNSGGHFYLDDFWPMSW